MKGLIKNGMNEIKEIMELFEKKIDESESHFKKTKKNKDEKIKNFKVKILF